MFAGEGADPVQYALSRALRDRGGFCWPNATMADLDGRTAGMLVAHPLDESVDPEDWPDLFRPFIRLENLRIGWTYIAALAVEPWARGRGIGSALLHSLSHRPTCLIRGDTNRAATLYRRHGYADVDREAVVEGAGWSSPYRHWVLMDRPIGLAPVRETR